MLDSANILGVVCSNFLCSFLKEQQYIIITGFRSFGQIFADKFWKITWISQNPLIVLFIDTPKGVKSLFLGALKKHPVVTNTLVLEEELSWGQTPALA